MNKILIYSFFIIATIIGISLLVGILILLIKKLF